jgi:hypothetical protein
MSLFAGQPALSAPQDPLVSADDYAEWYGLGNGTAASLTTLEQAQIQTALEIASAMIRNGRREFSPVTSEVELVDSSPAAETVMTSRYRIPVTNVLLVEEFDGSTYTTVDASEYTWTADGIIQRLSWRCWRPGLAAVRVTYDHGYTTLPRDVAGVCLRLASRLLNNPSGTSLVREALGDASVEYSAAGGTTLLPEEETILSQYESRA